MKVDWDFKLEEDIKWDLVALHRINTVYKKYV